MDNSNNASANPNIVALKSGAATRQEEVMEIDLLELGYMLLEKWHYILLFALVGAVLMNAYSYFFIHPTYQSTASIYIVNASGGSVVDLTDLNIGNSLKGDYKELIMSYPVLDRVSKKLDLGWSTKQMSAAISVVNPADTRILKLTATAEDPQLAMKIANTLANVVVEYLPATMSTEAPNIAQKARLPESKANPSYAKYTLIGGLLGALLSCAWFVMLHLMDDTIRTEDDMEKYFGFPPLTAVPYSEVIVQADEGNASRRRRRRRTRNHNEKAA